MGALSQSSAFDKLIRPALSGMLQKFHSFQPILLSFLTYVLLSYSVRLYCANIHTPSPFFLSYLYDFQTMKTQNIKGKVVKSIRAREDL